LARGINFHLFTPSDGGEEVFETARVKRCARELMTSHAGNEDLVAACRPAAGGHLLAVKEGTGARLKFIVNEGKVRWERSLEGTIVFQEEFFLVVELAAGHRAIWLSAKDGSTTRTMDFVERAAPVGARPCDDRLMRWFQGPGGVTAAICLVLD
jgi:hypothetical protein